MLNRHPRQQLGLRLLPRAGEDHACWELWLECTQKLNAVGALLGIHCDDLSIWKPQLTPGGARLIQCFREQ